MTYSFSYYLGNKKVEFNKSFKNRRSFENYVSLKISKGAKLIKTSLVKPSSYYNEELESNIVKEKKNIVLTPCIYALIQDDKIVYIGQTYDIMRRLSVHIDSYKVFDSYAIVEWVQNKDSKHLSDLEAKYIKELKPKYNTIHN